MTKTIEIGTGEIDYRCILRKANISPPEYNIMTFSRNWDGAYTVYFAQLIDNHYILTRSKGDKVNVFGVTHKESEADSRLAELARGEFNKIFEEFKNPSVAAIEFRKKYGDKEPTKQVFINEID